MEIQQFTLGKDAYPEWFKQLAAENKVYFKQDDQGNLERVTIKTLTGPIEAVSGDVITYSVDATNNSHSIQVIPSRTAEMYMR